MLGRAYRQRYPHLSFAEKQQLMDAVLQHHFQIVCPPRFLLACLSQLGRQDLRIVELGGYDGSHAADVLDVYPAMCWVNYDISHIAANLTRPELATYHYAIEVLEQPFSTYDLGQFDLFYSSKTLEHLTIREVLDTLTATHHAAHQVHIIDWFWRDDTHVIEKGTHDTIIAHLQRLGYTMRTVVKERYQSRIFCSRDTP